jgi:hypothetical protein
VGEDVEIVTDSTGGVMTLTKHTFKRWLKSYHLTRQVVIPFQYGLLLERGRRVGTYVYL